MIRHLPQHFVFKLVYKRGWPIKSTEKSAITGVAGRSLRANLLRPFQ
jgi:hypothetical protein